MLCNAMPSLVIIIIVVIIAQSPIFSLCAFCFFSFAIAGRCFSTAVHSPNRYVYRSATRNRSVFPLFPDPPPLLLL